MQRILGMALLAWLMLAGQAHAGRIVKVGVVLFPPYIVLQQDARGSTLRVELLELMNSFQRDYRFVPVVSGPLRRFHDFDQGMYDLSFYDNLAWGWKDRAVDATKVFLRGGEVYVALARHGRDENYFADLSDKRMIGMRGYHYGFAGFNNDPAFLRERFQMSFTDDNEATLRLLLLERGDVAVVTEAYLAGYLIRNPQDKDRLLISRKKDQPYSHSIIVRRGARPTVDELNQLLDKMQRAGVLKPLWRKYGADAEGNYPDKP
ncbi:substrate-binding periplasmic protein [Chitinimonas sp. JJ19]|uniref:substrate-binding periplasmic protein n=1 Tax=Chitinimonas sp. JJ19 TaxID=3109352 RepID=UPI0030029A20